MHVSRYALLACCLLALLPSAAHAQDSRGAVPTPRVTLFRDVRVLNSDGTLSKPTSVLVRGETIARIAPAIADEAGAAVIDAGGRTLMPGLIDAHWHAMNAAISLNDGLNGDVGYVNIVAARAATDTLMRGFTSVRDLAGPAFGLKRAIDEGVVAGPRIWPSGAMISQTSGHGDYRAIHELPRTPGLPPNRAEAIGAALIADGPDEVRRRVREELMRGASQIKLAAGGGVASVYDPLDVAQYTEAEFRAAVEAAENWGTYVTVHAYTPRAIQMAIRGGVRCVDHGQLIDDATAKLMAEKGVWLSIQPFLDDEDAIPFPEGSINRAKQLLMTRGTDTAYSLAKKYRLKTAWGTDTLFDAKLATRQGAQLAKLTRWYTPPEILKMATANNAELLAMSGPRNPYPGRLGVVEEGALADLLLVDGDPVANIALIADPAKNFLVIMKGGRIYKQTIR